jgi:tetratricopeptide (TPR) repeat protein
MPLDPASAEFAERIEKAFEHHHAGRSERALEELDVLLNASASEELDALRPVVQARRATVLRSLQFFDQAIDASSEASRGFRRLGNLEEVIKQILMMASIWSRIGEFGVALELCNEASELSDLVDNDRLRASVESNRGIALGRLGRYREESEAARTALTIMQKLGDRRGSAVASLNLGACYSNLGMFGEALPLLIESRRTLLSLGYMMPSFAAANGLIEAYIHTNRLAEAREVLQELQATQAASDRAAGDLDSPGTEEQEALVLAAEGQFDQAAAIASAGGVVLAERDMRAGAARLHAIAADAHLRAGRPAKARESCITAFDLFNSCEHGGGQELLRILAPWAESEFSLEHFQLAAGLMKDALAQFPQASESYLANVIYKPRIDNLAAALQSRAATLEDA